MLCSRKMKNKYLNCKLYSNCANNISVWEAFISFCLILVIFLFFFLHQQAKNNHLLNLWNTPLLKTCSSNVSYNKFFSKICVTGWKHIKYTITIFRRVSSSNPSTFQTVLRSNGSQVSYIMSVQEWLYFLVNFEKLFKANIL